MTEKELVNAGYEKYGPSKIDKCDALFQKCISNDENEKLYYITIKRYDIHLIDKRLTGPLWEASVQFVNQDEKSVNMNTLNGWTLEEIEDFYDKMWNTGLFKKYSEVY